MRRATDKAYISRSRSKAALVLGITMAYVLAYPLLDPFLNNSGGILSVVPVITGAWLWGLRAGLVLSVLMFPLNSLIVVLLMDRPLHEWLVNGGILGTGALALVGGMVGGIRDLGQRTKRELAQGKRLEQDLRESEERYRSLAELSPEAMFVTVGGKFAYVNQASLELFAASSAEDLLGKRSLDFAHPGEREMVADRIRRVIQGERLCFGDTRIVRLDGEARDVSGSGVTIVYSGQQAMQVVLRDVTERKRTEREIQRLALAVATAGEAVIIVGMDGRVSFVNRAAELMTGYAAGEMSGIEVFNLHAESSEHATPGDIFEATLTDASWTGEVLYRKKTGEKFPVRLSTALMKDEEGRPTGMVGIAADITERLELENLFLQAQKMEAVGQLAGGVAHDFNNLLTVIMSFTSLTITELPAGDNLNGYLQEVLRAAGRAANLTRQLLTFSRRQIADPQILSLNDVVLNMERMLRRVVSEDIELVVVAAPDLATVKVDPGQMEQVLANLVVNARDAMSGGGKLIIETSNVVLDEDYARSHLEVAPGDHVLLAVRDTGTGMTKDTKARAFEPFFTTKEVGQGTGLGLSTCYGIAAQNGGHITIDSDLGRGTTVRIYLPSVGAQGSMVDTSVCPGYLPLGNETVLLVEDEPTVRSAAAETLRGQGYTVLEASNGVDALNIVAEHRDEPIDLLLTDMVMPLVGGRALVAKLNEAHFVAKVLYTSGYSEESLVDPDVLKAGADFLQKPFTPATLAQKVRAVLDGP